MSRRRRQLAGLAGPWLTVGSAVAAIVELGLGAPWPRALDYFWPGVVIGWSLLVLAGFRTNRLNRETIGYQRETIKTQLQVITELRRRAAWRDN